MTTFGVSTEKLLNDTKLITQAQGCHVSRFRWACQAITWRRLPSTCPCSASGILHRSSTLSLDQWSPLSRKYLRKNETDHPFRKVVCFSGLAMFLKRCFVRLSPRAQKRTTAHSIHNLTCCDQIWRLWLSTSCHQYRWSGVMRQECLECQAKRIWTRCVTPFPPSEVHSGTLVLTSFGQVIPTATRPKTRACFTLSMSAPSPRQRLN